MISQIRLLQANDETSTTVTVTVILAHAFHRKLNFNLLREREPPPPRILRKEQVAIRSARSRSVGECIITIENSLA
jgi:hypothetical protein